MILEKITSKLPEEKKNKDMEVFMDHHLAISVIKFNLGQCKMDLHEITLRTLESIFLKQINK